MMRKESALPSLSFVMFFRFRLSCSTDGIGNGAKDIHSLAFLYSDCPAPNNTALAMWDRFVLNPMKYRDELR
jgi:hypothetical protein